MTWGAVAIVAVVLAGVGYFISLPAPAPHSYVTSLQKGEYGVVPDACKVIPSATLRLYLGGRASAGVRSSSGGGKSECTYQFDAKPTFRVLDITITAYLPSLIAPGNGSATSYATYTFAQTKQQLVRPPKHTPEPPAEIKAIGGIGAESLAALQVYHVGSVQDRATVLTRWRNVLITTSLWATVSGGFGPVSVTALVADASAAARQVLKAVRAEPTVGG